MKTQTWLAAELTFTAAKAIGQLGEEEVDVRFVHEKTGKTILMPAFWDGGTTWKVRFALPEAGMWRYTVQCAWEEFGLNGVSGTVECEPYTGELEIYKRGFVKTEPGKRYFVYDDGTPFFYLGDTHWAMLREEIDEPGPHAGDLKVDSCFRAMADHRAAQRFTVYQSEPLGHKYNVFDGIDETDVADFRRVDRYFSYIAEKGFLHANAELIFPGEIGSIESPWFDETFLYRVTRYWVARYAAYPVLWTLGQEVDRSYFNKCGITPENNPYRTMCRFIDRLDPYKHPITAHQENAMICGAKGGAVTESPWNWGEDAKKRESQRSSFYGVKEHTWWGVQWRPDVDRQHSFEIPKDYWYNGEDKVAINYEGRYDYLYTKNYGARANGWISYLSGMYGYGYGAADIWCYKSRYSFDSTSGDGVDTVLPEEKEMMWSTALYMPTGDQMTYLRSFFEKLAWWRLVPEFDNEEYFRKTGEGYYTAAHDGNDVYAVYLYRKTTDPTGVLRKLDTKAAYTAQWFDPRTGEYTLIDDAITAPDGTFAIPEKPIADDMVLLVTKNA